MTTCSLPRSTPATKCSGLPSARTFRDAEQIARTGGDVYLHTLINLDTEARLWIGKIIAGAT